MLEDPSKKYDEKCLQDMFRRRAQKQIDKTKEMLDYKNPKGFHAMKKRALEKTIAYVDKLNARGKGNFDELFELYFQQCLQRETELIEEFVIPKIGLSARSGR